MSVELIDTHCHLDRDPLAGDVDGVLARARAAGVVACVTIGTDLPSSRANVVLAKRSPMLRAAVGIHPHDVDHTTEVDLQAIEQLAQEPEVVAIGEVGLDRYRQLSDPGKQEAVFQEFLGMAQRLRRPVLMHCRDAHEPLLKILRGHPAGACTGLMHCASGPPEFIQEALALGLYVSFAGNVTFPKADALRALVPLVPDDRLLLETDAPFLAPQPVRGQPNEPAFIAHTAATVAQLRGTTLESLTQMTTQNACKLFGLRGIE